MVRRGSFRTCAVGLVVAVVALGACSGSDDEDEAEVVDPDTPITMPDDVDRGFGYLLLDGEPTLLYVRACTFEPVVDAATGVTTELAIDLDDQVSRAVSVTRSSFGGDLATTTDEILIADDEVITLDATRIDRSGTMLDLRAPGVLEPLLEVDGSLVSATGVFGPTGSQDGDAGLVGGELLLRCP